MGQLLPNVFNWIVPPMKFSVLGNGSDWFPEVARQTGGAMQARRVHVYTYDGAGDV